MGEPPPPPYGPLPGAPPLPPPARAPGPLVFVLIAVGAAVLLVIGGVVGYLVVTGDEPEPIASSGPLDLREPLTFALVEEVSDPPCGGGALTVAGAGSCYSFGSDRLTVRRLEEVRALGPDPAAGRTGWSVSITLTPADAAGFAELTGRAAKAYAGRLPGGRMGMLLGGTLLSEPAQVAAPIPGGRMQIDGAVDRPDARGDAESLVHRLTGR
ncbi:SecDF P1 head subdomain-containing protein [Actinomadura chokoriensis]|uniref:SecDF P1 head subdomain domain-containing protein n=1 Tax=Actinomadura chokoriensis TaxID=454156 RepID=A0ABV4QXI1_9ACTN